jgi:coenzyme F420-reducing hydrogenase alpha subunit
VSASRIFVGKGIAETTVGLPTLFSVCATAQSVACAGAIETALGHAASPRCAQIRRMLVDAETVREHLWRVLLDWPDFLGAAVDAPAMARVMAASGRLRAALSVGADLMRPVAGDPVPDLDTARDCLEELSSLSADHLFGEPPASWLDRTDSAHGLRTWAGETHKVAARLLNELDARGWAAAGRSAVPSLPVLSPAELDARLGAGDVEAFVSAPTWDDGPAESSPYSRNLSNPVVAGLTEECGNGLLPRLGAQLVELAALQAGLLSGLETLRSDTGLPTPDPIVGLPAAVGIAQVQAARGLLVHRATLLGDLVADYRILAPTEWNFHPGGAVVAGLAALPDVDDETLGRLAGLFITAVDPCVEYELTIS